MQWTTKHQLPAGFGTVNIDAAIQPKGATQPLPASGFEILTPEVQVLCQVLVLPPQVDDSTKFLVAVTSHSAVGVPPLYAVNREAMLVTILPPIA